MALAVEIQSNSPSITCEQGASAECAFDVRNTSNRPLRVGIEALGANKSWITLVDEAQKEINLPAQGQQKIKVKATAPADAKPDKYTFTLRAYDPQTAEAIESGAVALEVKAKPVPKPEPGPGPKPPPSKLGLIIAAVVGGIVLIGGIITAIIIFSNGAEVPNVVMNEDGTPMMANDAVTLLEAEDLEAVITETFSEAPAGTVISQDPAAGAAVPDDGKVQISIAMVSTEVPSVVSFNVSAARTALGAAGLDADTVVEETRNSPGGTVIRQSPAAGTRAIPGSIVVLTIEKELAAVPDLAGQTLELANQRLKDAGLVIAQRGIVNTGAQPGTVVAQDPQAGAQVDQGTSVQVDLETARIAVPNVNNRTLQDAIRVLGGAQLIVAPIQPVYFSEGPFDVISAQNPAAGATVPPGTPVTLSVRTYSPPMRVYLNTAVLSTMKYVRSVDGSLRAAPREE